jgi:shikimate kinase / 3-dehydroquinate synthase
MGAVFLIGFMGSGKTTVGRVLAADLGYDFVDLDAAVEDAAGMTVAEIFAAEGEPGFRARERQALDAVLARQNVVVATGGGTPCFGDALARMRRAGAVVALTAQFEQLQARVGDAATRPLWADAEVRVRHVLAERMPVYRQAHFGVATDDLPIGAVVARIRAGLRTLAAVPDSHRANSAVVALPQRSYPIVVAAGLLARAGEWVQAHLGGVRQVGVVTDDTVAELYLEPIRHSLAAQGVQVCTAVIPAGEQSKTLATVGDVADTLIQGGLDRSSAIVALGGGVVGDLAGFVAATLFRGVRVVQVPTTLLAMIDSSIGGKTGVDVPAGKNLIGAFWQPELVLADTETLATLPAREIRAGFGELVKYGLLDSEELFERCSSIAPTDPELIRRCAAYKAWVVARDEREQTGERALLNLGHTVGHAIEAEAGYGRLLHGECVALGLLATCRVSARLGLADPSLEDRVRRVLAGAGLDTDLTPWMRDEVLRRIGVDKKRVGRSVTFIALQGVGQPVLHPLELDELVKLLYD